MVPLVHDGLVAYRRVNGIGGGSLVANLAERVPTPTDQGTDVHVPAASRRPLLGRDARTCIGLPLQLRTTADLIRARRGIDLRDCRLNGVRGSGDRGLRPLAGHRGRRCHRDDHDPPERGRPGLPAQARFPSAFVVPAGTPLRMVENGSIPTTGPYRIASLDPKRELRLVRNPHFRVWSSDARPDGYPDEIRFHFER